MVRDIGRFFAHFREQHHIPGRIQIGQGGQPAVGNLVAEDRTQARELVLGLIPAGSEVNQASSKTVDDLGIGEAIVEREEYIALKPRIWSTGLTNFYLNSIAGVARQSAA
jgi:hypothetical protein